MTADCACVPLLQLAKWIFVSDACSLQLSGLPSGKEHSAYWQFAPLKATETIPADEDPCVIADHRKPPYIRLTVPASCSPLVIATMVTSVPPSGGADRLPYE